MVMSVGQTAFSGLASSSGRGQATCGAHAGTMKDSCGLHFSSSSSSSGSSSSRFKSAVNPVLLSYARSSASMRTARQRPPQPSVVCQAGKDSLETEDPWKSEPGAGGEGSNGAKRSDRTPSSSSSRQSDQGGGSQKNGGGRSDQPPSSNKSDRTPPSSSKGSQGSDGKGSRRPNNSIGGTGSTSSMDSRSDSGKPESFLERFMSTVSKGLGDNGSLKRTSSPGIVLNPGFKVKGTAPGSNDITPGGPWTEEPPSPKPPQKEANFMTMSMDGLETALKDVQPPFTNKPKKIDFSNTDWDWGGWDQDWDPIQNLDDEELEEIADRTEEGFRNGIGETPRDKFMNPVLDWRSVFEALDPDQERTEESMRGEALANMDETQTAVQFVSKIFGVPLIIGFIASHSLADPITSYVLENNKEAFAMTYVQKVEGAETVHIEETRLRFDMAVGRAPPLSEAQILEHLREFAKEVQDEERQGNQQDLITIVSDSISFILFFSFLIPKSRGRRALANTIARLFDGLSDIAKAVLIILVSDTLLGYHSEEGWTGLIELVLGHYGIEAEEESVILFVGTVPVLIDVYFKYWIFVGLNKISPAAVTTIRAMDK